MGSFLRVLWAIMDCSSSLVVHAVFAVPWAGI